MTERRHRLSAGTDRWMVSWADLLTLLFASVVVLYASAARHGFPAANAKKVSPPAAAAAVVPSPAKTESQPKDDLSAPFAHLRNSLHDEIRDGRLEVSLETRGIVVSLQDQSYFTSGSDDLTPDAIRSIGEVVSVIRDLPNTVRLEGHTDSVPIHNARFRDNWSLSAARSTAVLTLLESRFGISPSKLALAAYADNNPVAENESAAGRARNRRVDIVILSQTNL